MELKDGLGILIAALGGSAAGLEREWSGHASGPGARFAGTRTFTLLGLLFGLVGWLWSHGVHLIAGLLLAGCAVLILTAYLAESRVEVDGTTEVAALVVLGAGVVAGMRELRLASAVIAITTLLLVEKSRLYPRAHRRCEPAGWLSVCGYGGGDFAETSHWALRSPRGIRPRQLCAMVLFFLEMNFAGDLARRSVGSKRGYPIAGMLDGIVSSTNVTLSFARASRHH